MRGGGLDSWGGASDRQAPARRKRRLPPAAEKKKAYGFRKSRLSRGRKSEESTSTGLQAPPGRSAENQPWFPNASTSIVLSARERD